MSTVARRFAASPTRLSSDVWKAITSLICQSDIAALAEFGRISGMGSCLINDRLLADAPLIVKNKGPRLKVYCLYGEDALDGEQINEGLLTWKPTESDWQVFMPCNQDELSGYSEELKARSSNFFVYDAKEGLEEDNVKTEAAMEAAGVAVDWEAFNKL